MLLSQGDHLTALTRACLIGEQAYLSAEYLLTQNANPNGTEEVSVFDCFLFILTLW